MHIAYVSETFPPEINGAALTAERSVDHLRASGHAVQLIRPRQPHEAARRNADEWRCAGAPLPLAGGLRCGLATPAALRALWRDTGLPEVVHVATPGPLGWAALTAARAEGLPTSADFRTHLQACSAHYGLGWMAPAMQAYQRRLHAMADTTFVPTPELQGQLQAQGFERLQVVGRGVDAQCFSPERRDARLRWEWRAEAEDMRVLLYVGRLVPEKNAGLALHTFERLSARRPGLRMVVVGDGPLREKLERAHPRARFVGMQTGAALARHYASADVFLFPSLTDTFGHVTLEALASGLAVAAFDSGAAGQYVRDGESGCLVPPCEGLQAADAFLHAATRALEAWAPDSALRQQARQAALQADWGRVLRRFEQQLHLLAATGRTLPRHAAALA